MSKQTGWEHFKHVADIGIRGYGVSPAEAFSQAALAMTAVITEIPSVEKTSCIDVDCESIDLEYLFVDWLNALVYEMAIRKMLFSEFDVQINNNHLKARVCGERVDRDKHQPAVEIKGATLTELSVSKLDGTWVAQCIIDV